jgi:hypothetical protein
VDGRHFELQASLHGLDLRVDGYVVLEDDDGRRLGQVVELELARIEGSEVSTGEGELALRTRMNLRAARGEGVVLDGDGNVETDLRLVILDPNSDYLRLGEVRPGATDEQLAAACR